MHQFDPTKLSIEEKIGQLFFIGLPGPDLDAATAALLGKIRPGGVCLFARNIKGAEQTRALLDGIRASLSIVPFLSLDQEGGRVDRLRRVLTPMPAASQLRSAEDAAELGSIIGEATSLLGFNMDFAPVVDVMAGSRAGFVNGLQTRGFGKSKDDVVSFANAFQDSLADHGILGCLKHFPGLAASTVDSHEELPTVSLNKDELHEMDLHPYRELLHRDDVSVMVAHAVYPSADLQDAGPDGKLLPSSLDPRIVTSLLRDELNFKGVAITDDMEMGAIVRHYGIGEASKMAVKAGEDMIAICASEEAIYEAHGAVTEAVSSNEITEAMLDRSVHRIFRLKMKIAEPQAFNLERFNGINERIKNLNQHLN
jgi:beta-N-acetylhexosaminidase